MNTITHMTSKLAAIGVIAASAFGLPGAALAASLNTVPGTPPTVQVANFTDNPNSSNTAWFSTVNADAGEVVSVGVLYHNSSSEVANDVRVRLSLPSGVSVSHAFAGTVTAANANSTSGNATVNLSSSQALSLVSGGIFWRIQGCTACTQPFPFGQNGNELFTSEGLRLGNIAPNDFGNITVRFQVSNTTTGTGGTGGGATQGNLIGISTNSPTGVTTSSATLNGTVSINGISSTQVYFEWGNDSFLSTFNTTAPQSVSSTQSYAQSISGLAANTNYYYRAVAVSGGMIVRGAIASFNTGSVSSGLNAPIVITRGISKTGVPSTVIANGSLISNGGDPTTQAWFEWGLTTGLGNRTQTRTISGGDFTDTLSNLSPNTVYFVRAVSRNDFDTAFGQIVSFQADPTIPTIISPVVTTAPIIVPSVVVPSTGAGISLSKTVQNLSFPNGTDTQIAAWAGNTMEHAIVVRNTGSVTLSNLIVSDRVSDSVEFKEAFDGGIRSGADVQWNITLSSGESRTLRYRFVGKRLSDNVVIERSALATNNVVSRRSNATLTILNKFPLTATIAANGDTVRAGEQVVYTITYKNEGAAELADVSVRAVMPAEVSFNSASNPSFTRNGNDLVFSIGRLGPNETGAITVTGTVGRDVAVGSVITFAATVSYKDAFSSRQFDETAIMTSQVVAGGPFGAAALGLGQYLPGGVLGWLLLILILVAVALVARRAMQE